MQVIPITNRFRGGQTKESWADSNGGGPPTTRPRLCLDRRKVLRLIATVIALPTWIKKHAKELRQIRHSQRHVTSEEALRQCRQLESATTPFLRSDLRKRLCKCEGVP